MAVTYMLVGGVSSTSARVKAKMDSGSSYRLAVSTNSGMSSPTYFGPVSASESMIDITATGLSANTDYWFRIEQNSVMQTAFTGHFKTFPVPGSETSFRFAASSCAYGVNAPYPDEGPPHPRVSNSHVFDLIREEDPLFFAHLGDAHYRNLNVNDLALYRGALDDTFAAPKQHQLYRNVPIAYVWDDHDYGPDNSDSTAVGRPAAAQTFRERVPSYTVPSGNNPVYQSWTVGRVLFIMSDTRHARTPNSAPDDGTKTMLGATQKAWMRDILENSEAEAFVWLCPTPWHFSSADTWGGFARERNEIADMFRETGWTEKMVVIVGDYHAVGLDSGGNNNWGGFPIACFSSLDSPAGEPGTAGGSANLFDMGIARNGQEQYGIVDVNDSGELIEITMTAFIDGFLWNSYTKQIWPNGAPEVIAPLYKEIGYLTPYGGFSVEGWAWSDEEAGLSRCLFAQYDQWKPELGQIDLHRSNAGGVRVRIWNKNGSQVASTLFEDIDFGDSSWHHWAVTLQSDRRTLRVFFDGEVVSEATLNQVLDWNPGIFSFGGIHIQKGAHYEHYWSGRLAYCAWKNQYVAPEKIREHYQAGSGSHVFRGDTESQRIDRVLGWVRVPEWKHQLDPAASVLDATEVTGANALSTVQEAAQAADGLVFADGRGDVVYQSRSRRKVRWSVAELSETLGTAIESGVEFSMDQSWIYNDITGERPNSDIKIHRTDDGSIRIYGRKTRAVSIPVLSETELLSAVLWELYKYSTARTRLNTVTVQGLTSLGFKELVYGGLEVGDLITISDLPSNAPASSLNVFIENIQLDANADQWDLTFSLSPDFEVRSAKLDMGCNLDEEWVVGH